VISLPAGYSSTFLLPLFVISIRKPVEHCTIFVFAALQNIK
jgi:hypothetical protein